MNYQIPIYQGDLLNSKAQILGHQTNFQGVMGGGIAYTISKQYPEIMDAYQEGCYLKGENLLGKCQLIPTFHGNYIANIFSQNDSCDANGNLTNYEALTSSLNILVILMDSLGLNSVAFPYKFGCGIAGGDWNIVYEIFNQIFSNTDIKVEFWKLE